ncbi:MAG TPA: MFS transporter [Methanomassiliicoccales archaeon]|jgi:EmrB/QacA subfamily drug resistance transporter
MAIIKDTKGQAFLLIAIMFVVLMDGLDASIVNVALPSIASAFEIDTSTAGWVSVTYFMMMAGLLLAFGRLADRGIIKRMLVAGLIMFSIFSLACGVSSSIEMLLVSRIFQGVGAAIMGASAPLLCVRFLPANKLGVGLGIVTMGASIGYASGPALGGIITEYLSWHWIFLINIPIGLAGIAFLMKAIPKDEGYVRSYFDLPGSLLMFMAVLAGVFALERFTHIGLGNVQIISATAICISAFALFIIWERRCRTPILNPMIFRSREFAFVFAAFLLINLTATGMWYLTPFYLSLGMGFDAAICGVYLFVPAAITLMISAPIGKWSDRTGRRWFSVISCASMALTSGILVFIDPGMGTFPLIIALVLMGIIWGFSGGPAASRIVEKIDNEEKGTGAALIAVAGYLGGAIGTASFAAFFSVMNGSGNTPFPELPLSTFMEGFHGVMIIGVVLAILAAVLSAVVRDNKNAEP